MPQYSALHTQLKLNSKQKTLLAQHPGAARFTWNWALEICMAVFPARECCLSAIDLHNRPVAEIKSEKSWFDKVSKCFPQFWGWHLQEASRTWGKLKVKADNAQNSRRRGIYYSGA